MLCGSMYITRGVMEISVHLDWLRIVEAQFFSKIKKLSSLTRKGVLMILVKVDGSPVSM